MWNNWLVWTVEARSQPWYHSLGTIQLGSSFFFLLYVYVSLVCLYVYRVHAYWMPWNCVYG